MGVAATDVASPRVKQIVMIMTKTRVMLSRTEPMMARGKVTEASLISSAKDDGEHRLAG